MATFLLSCGIAAAEDRVTLVPEGAIDPVVMIGTVEDFSGREIVIQRTGTPSPDHFPAARVISVQTWHTVPHDRGLAEFNDGKTVLAEQTLLKALRDESRDWVQRDILASLVRCSIRQGDWGTAGTRFQKITSQDPYSPHWNVAPLIWAPQSIGDQSKTLARGWMNESGAASQLLAASWLLLDGVYGEPATRRLNELARDSNSIIAAFARCQLWRLRLGPDLNEIELAKWKAEVRRLPKIQRAGPQYLLGRGLIMRQDLTAGVGELMWLPTVYSDNEDLTARAMSDSGQALVKLGKTREAATVFDDLLTRYPWSTWAAEARQARSVLSRSGDSGENPPQ